MNTMKEENGSEVGTFRPENRWRRTNTIIKLTAPRAPRIGRTLQNMSRVIPVTRPGGCADVSFNVKISCEKMGQGANVKLRDTCQE